MPAWKVARPHHIVNADTIAVVNAIGIDAKGAVDGVGKMSVVLVTGGTGTLGRPLVSVLRNRGHEVRVLSRRPPSTT